jgi:hypothetical protein
MFITATPWVPRPCWLIASARVRITMPSREIRITSWLARIARATASGPLRSVTRKVSTPWPPRPLVGYPAIGVRLPTPSSETTSRSSPSVSTTRPISTTPSGMRMPRTPPEAREATRSVPTRKRIARPPLLTRIASSSSPAARAATRWSPPLRFIAIRPARRTDSNWLSGVRLTSPFAVATTIESRLKSVTTTIAVTWSPSSISIRLTTGMPRAWRVASGTS